MKKAVLFSLMMLAALVMSACSSAPAKKDAAVLTAADSAAIAAAVAAQGKQQPVEEARLPQNIDAAHESFIRASLLELRGEKTLANVFWQHAAESDPYNRFLAFKLVEILAAQGADSVALVNAERANKLEGKVTASQLSILAHLYVKASRADSSRKYFKAALDSARYQDMPLLYDYSLFLEAIHDEEELVRIYDLLLPHVNYMQSLFQRQLNLLLDLHRDSAVVELFGKAHDATGDKKLLTQMVQGLVFQKRMGEVKAIVDTLSGTTSEDEAMVVLLMTNMAETSRDSAFALLKKKYYEDGVRTAVLANFLGHYEHLYGELDSAKVHLTYAAEHLGFAENRVYVTNAYHALANIAFKEKQYKEVVRYAEKADSVAMGGDKAMLAMSYGMVKMYDKAYKMLDSLIAVWDKWNPMAGVADSATLEKMKVEVQQNKVLYRSFYARMLNSEATDIVEAGKGDTSVNKKALEIRKKSLKYFDEILSLEPDNYDIMSQKAMILERCEMSDESYALFEFLLDSSRADKVDRPELLNYYGYTLIERNRSAEDVEKGYQMVLQALATEKSKAPSDAYLDSKAWGEYRMGKFTEALETIKLVSGKTIENDPVYWEHRGAIEAALGMYEDATASYQKLRTLRPKNPEALRFLKTPEAKRFLNKKK